MTNYTYTKNIPASNHNPSVDQPSMQTNTNSIANLIGEDHYTFGVDNGGFHKQIRLPDLAAIGNLAPRIANSGTLWTQKANSVGISKESNLFYVPDLTSDDYQLTRTVTSAKTLFGLLTENYNAVGAGFFGGWTFLPGGLLFQYGYTTNVTNSATTTIKFPVKFTTTFMNVQCTVQTDDDSTVRFSILGDPSTTQFVTSQTKTSHFKRLYWQAIGK